MFNGFRIAQIISIVMVVIGIIILTLVKKGSVFTNRYNDPDFKENVRF